MAVELRLSLAADGDEEGYALRRVFALPCGEAPTEAGLIGPWQQVGR